jgi:hypothetical protein
MGFERPSRQRRAELLGKAIDPWDHKAADEERRFEGLPPVHFRRREVSLAGRSVVRLNLNVVVHRYHVFGIARY